MQGERYFSSTRGHASLLLRFLMAKQLKKRHETKEGSNHLRVTTFCIGIKVRVHICFTFSVLASASGQQQKARTQ